MTFFLKDYADCLVDGFECATGEKGELTALNNNSLILINSLSFNLISLLCACDGTNASYQFL